MRPFSKLTTVGQARRLKELARTALVQYPIKPKRIRLLCAEYNAVFRVDTTDGKRYAMRVSGVPPQGQEVRSLSLELRWLSAIHKDTSLQTPVPIQTCTGENSVLLAHPGVPEPRLCVLFSWLPGKELFYSPVPLRWWQFGAFVAALHEHASSFSLAPDETRHLRVYNSPFPFSEPVVLFEPCMQQLFSQKMRRLLRETHTRLEDALQENHHERSPMHLLHGDLHHLNVKTYHNRIAAFDFEDLMWGHPIQDIAVTMYAILDHPDYFILRNAFCEGYSDIRTWPAQCDAELDLFIAGRSLILLNLIVQSPRLDYKKQLPSFLARSEQRLHKLLKHQR